MANTPAPAPAPTISSPNSSACPFLVRRLTKTTALPRLTRAPHRGSVSCRTGPIIDRRDVLLGIGLGLGLNAENALSAPVQAPDLSKCKTASDRNGLQECCPPYNSNAPILDYNFPTFGDLRVRRAAHTIDDAYLAKYKLAVQRMRELPDDDPRSFTQQAKVHCAYCSNAYEQVGFPNLNLQVHNGWLFFPFHRYYLYFHERILGSLIGDDSFALPFWNWDAPEGMSCPAIFADSTSSLYNPLREDRYRPPNLINYDLPTQKTPPSQQVIDQNLATMYRQMISGGTTTSLFMGQPYRAGSAPSPGAGSIEVSPHTPVHRWLGKDMGVFATAGKDPAFYSHHANVDRMWYLWKTLNPENVDFVDPDWLDTAFLFYDENKNLVRVKVKDSLEPEQLGFSYEDVDIPWRYSRATPNTSSGTLQSLSPSEKKKKRASLLKSTTNPSFPLTLSAPVTLLVQRPKSSRLMSESDKKRETLVVDGIELDSELFAKFNVYVDEDDPANVKADDSEFAGSFVNVPLGHAMDMEPLKTRLFLGIGDLIEDLALEDEEKLIVTLIPIEGNGEIKIGSVRIEIAS